MRNQNLLKSIGFLAADENGFQASGRLGDSERLARRLKPGKVKASLSCRRFGGHEDKIVTHEPESGYDETEVQPRVQD
jgi:hypothetical protein